MIPQKICSYLDDNEVDYLRKQHPRAVSAQELAASVHVSGRRVAKAVLIEMDGVPIIAVLPATESADLHRLTRAVGGHSARMMTEGEFTSLFPDCEAGAEPPFGHLYGLPVIVDSELAGESRIVVRAGSHEECIEMPWNQFMELEKPRVVSFGAPADTKAA